MSNENLPIARETLDQLSGILSRMTENLGGDHKQLEANFAQQLCLNDLIDAMDPLMLSPYLSASLTMEGGQVHPLFIYGVDPFADRDENGDRVVTTLRMTLYLTHPNLQGKPEWIKLLVGKDISAVAFYQGMLSTYDDTKNAADIPRLEQMLQQIESGLGQQVRVVAQTVLLAAVNAISPKDLHSGGRVVQDQVNDALQPGPAEAGDGTGNASRKAELPLSEKMMARVQEILRFLESVYGLTENELTDLFEPTLRELVQNNERLTLAGLRESAFSHGSLADMVSHAAANIDEANLLAFEIPLKDDNGQALDSLILAFSTDNITVELKSGNLSIAAKATQANVFKAKGVATAASSSGNVSAAQAKQNREMISGALRTLMPSAQGDSANKIREALLTINGFS